LRSRDAACPPLCLLSLHDALPILAARTGGSRVTDRPTMRATRQNRVRHHESHKRSLPAIAEQCSRACTTTRTCIPHNQQLTRSRSEEHTSELQSRFDLVCRLLLEK